MVSRAALRSGAIQLTDGVLELGPSAPASTKSSVCLGFYGNFVFLIFGMPKYKFSLNLENRVFLPSSPRGRLGSNLWSRRFALRSFTRTNVLGLGLLLPGLLGACRFCAAASGGCFSVRSSVILLLEIM